MPKTDKSPGRAKGKSKAPANVVLPPDEEQVDDSKTVATDEVEGNDEAQAKIATEEPAGAIASSQAGPETTESGANDPAETSDAGENGAERKPILGGKRRAVKVKDKDSGTIYDSKSKAGKALAEEFGLDPNDNFVWYRIVKLSPSDLRRSTARTSHAMPGTKWHPFIGAGLRVQLFAQCIEGLAHNDNTFTNTDPPAAT